MKSNRTVLLLKSSCTPVKVSDDTIQYSSNQPREQINFDDEKLSLSSMAIRNFSFVDQVNGFNPSSSSSATKKPSVTNYNAPARMNEQFILSLPLQCDVTVLRRDTRELLVTYSDEPSGNAQRKKVITKRVVKFKQFFLPCGMDNIVAFEDPSAVAGTLDSLPVLRRNNFQLSLTNCQTTSHDSSLSLPIDTTPSTLQFVLDGESDGYYSNTRENARQELYVSFDFSLAVKIYQKDHERRIPFCEPTHQRESWTTEVDVLNSKKVLTDNLINISTQPFVVNKHHEISSIIHSLEQKSQSFKQILYVLGSVGFLLSIALICTVRQIIHKTKNRAPSVLQDTRQCHSLPYEIETINQSDVHTVERTPIQSQERERTEASSVSSLRVDVEGIQAQTCPETLDVLHQNASYASTPSEETFKDSNLSPRHWYEEYLSPSIDVVRMGNRKSMILATPEKNELSRSLVTIEPKFSKSKLFAEETAMKHQVAVNVHCDSLTMSGQKKIVSPEEHIPCHEIRHRKDSNETIQGIFTVPACSVDILQLANELESSLALFHKSKPAPNVVNPRDIQEINQNIALPLNKLQSKGLLFENCPGKDVEKISSVTEMSQNNASISDRGSRGKVELFLKKTENKASSKGKFKNNQSPAHTTKLIDSTNSSSSMDRTSSAEEFIDHSVRFRKPAVMLENALPLGDTHKVLTTLNHPDQPHTPQQDESTIKLTNELKDTSNSKQSPLRDRRERLQTGGRGKVLVAPLSASDMKKLRCMTPFRRVGFAEELAVVTERKLSGRMAKSNDVISYAASKEHTERRNTDIEHNASDSSKSTDESIIGKKKERMVLKPMSSPASEAVDSAVCEEILSDYW